MHNIIHQVTLDKYIYSPGEALVYNYYSAHGKDATLARYSADNNIGIVKPKYAEVDIFQIIKLLEQYAENTGAMRDNIGAAIGIIINQYGINSAINQLRIGAKLKPVKPHINNPAELYGVLRSIIVL